ncbi:hypothetical protein [Aeromicrobium alkaliterrae]|uniref:Helix-turn-helix domain-containing protein n=1 Tax=Aeromicrobium alkaliterrae TaxID=302168 RepID=A0ABP4VGC2_9ACTN
MGKLYRPSDDPDYDHNAVVPPPESQRSPSRPSDKLKWQTALLQRSIDEGMTPGCQHIALALSTYSNGDGTQAHPSDALLVRVTGTSKTKVSRSLRYLREHGWVEQVSRGSGGSGRASVYRLTIPA